MFSEVAGGHRSDRIVIANRQREADMAERRDSACSKVSHLHALFVGQNFPAIARLSQCRWLGFRTPVQLLVAYYSLLLSTTDYRHLEQAQTQHEQTSAERTYWVVAQLAFTRPPGV